MAESVKKASSSKSTRKTATTTAEVKKSAPKKTATKKAAPKAKAATKLATHDEIAQLAHRFWAERGGNHGQHEDDWYRAEQELLGKAS